MKIVRGDSVTHPDWPEYGVGRAAHIDEIAGYPRRWVAWINVSGHWQAGAYEPASLVYVGPPDAKQPEIKLA